MYYNVQKSTGITNNIQQSSNSVEFYRVRDQLDKASCIFKKLSYRVLNVFKSVTDLFIKCYCGFHIYDKFFYSVDVFLYQIIRLYPTALFPDLFMCKPVPWDLSLFGFCTFLHDVLNLLLLTDVLYLGQLPCCTFTLDQIHILGVTKASLHMPKYTHTLILCR